MGLHLGLIGGVGPAGAMTYYRTLTRLHAEAGRRLSLTMAHADLREMIANLEANDALAQAKAFARHIDQLSAAGCEAVAIAAIGGHFCISQLEVISSLPIINAITALDDHVCGSGFSKIGVLGTRAVMQTKLYGISKIEVLAPPIQEIDKIHGSYMDLSVAGVATPAQRQYLQAIARQLCLEQGAQAILLGGADLSLAFDMDEQSFPIIDAAEIHAEAIARRSLTS